MFWGWDGGEAAANALPITGQARGLPLALSSGPGHDFGDLTPDAGTAANFGQFASALGNAVSFAANPMGLALGLGANMAMGSNPTDITLSGLLAPSFDSFMDSIFGGGLGLNAAQASMDPGFTDAAGLGFDTGGYEDAFGTGYGGDFGSLGGPDYGDSYGYGGGLDAGTDYGGSGDFGPGDW